MVDVMQLVDDKITELTELYTRMDTTKDLVQLTPYELQDYNDNKIEKTVSVTRNTPAWQAFVMSNKLVKVHWQTVVESSDKLTPSKIRTIEQFSDDVWAQVDEFVGNKFGLSGGLNSWLANHVIVRSLIGVRWWLYYDKDKNLVIDCLPVDMRWCPFELNEWYCNISWRNAAAIKKQYGVGVSVSGNDIEVRDYWDFESEQVFVDKKKVFEQGNPFGTPTFVVIMPSVGFMLRDKGYIKYEAESFDFLDRELYDEQNRIASIAQSLALEAIIPGYEQADKEINLAKPAIIPPMPGENVRTDVPHTRVPRGDLNNAFVKSAADITQDINRGGVTDTEAGNNDQNRTALWVTTQNELLNEKLKPRVDALASFRQESIRMIISQYVKLGEVKKGAREIDLGILGMKHRYSAGQLGDPSTYRITYKPMMVSKEQNIANVAIANAQRGILPQRFILTDTLQVQDPDGMMRELEMEKAKQADPTIGLFEMALRYAEEAEELTGVDADAKNLESMMLTDSAVLMMRQRRAAAMPQAAQPSPRPAQPVPQEEVKPNTGGLMALTGPGGGNGGSPGAEVAAKVRAS